VLGVVLCFSFSVIASAAAEPVGDQFRVSNQGGDGDEGIDARRPDIAYNSRTNEFLSVWVGEQEDGCLGSGGVEPRG
jgi:hypothetical protein